MIEVVKSTYLHKNYFLPDLTDESFFFLLNIINVDFEEKVTSSYEK